MDELTRFARRLVERLAKRPEGAHGPVSVAELRKSVLPYAAQRRTLGLESMEDYETVLLRLVSEERGLVKTLPPAAAARCREELAQPNPDLRVLEEIADSTVQVTSLAAGSIVADEAQSVEPAPARQEPGPPPLAHCLHCHLALPSGRPVVFCPWCGERLIPRTCAHCGTELESGWRHCITCGAAVPPDQRPQS